MTDFDRYKMLSREMKRLTDKHGTAAVNLPEFQALWRAREVVKNRHGGMPPAAPITPVFASV